MPEETPLVTLAEFPFNLDDVPFITGGAWDTDIPDEGIDSKLWPTLRIRRQPTESTSHFFRRLHTQWQPTNSQSPRFHGRGSQYYYVRHDGQDYQMEALNWKREIVFAVGRSRYFEGNLSDRPVFEFDSHTGAFVPFELHGSNHRAAGSLFRRLSENYQQFHARRWLGYHWSHVHRWIEIIDGEPRDLYVPTWNPRNGGRPRAVDSNYDVYELDVENRRFVPVTALTDIHPSVSAYSEQGVNDLLLLFDRGNLPYSHRMLPMEYTGHRSEHQLVGYSITDNQIFNSDGVDTIPAPTPVADNDEPVSPRPGDVDDEYMQMLRRIDREQDRLPGQYRYVPSPVQIQILDYDEEYADVHHPLLVEAVEKMFFNYNERERMWVWVPDGSPMTEALGAIASRRYGWDTQTNTFVRRLDLEPDEPLMLVLDRTIPERIRVAANNYYCEEGRRLRQVTLRSVPNPNNQQMYIAMPAENDTITVRPSTANWGEVEDSNEADEDEEIDDAINSWIDDEEDEDDDEEDDDPDF